MQRLTARDEFIHAFRFLSDDIIVVANTTDKASLDLFALPELRGDTGLMPMTKVAKLLLPDPCGRDINELTFSNPPAKNGIARGSRHDVAGSVKPFINSSNNIICCCASVDDIHSDSYSYSLFVHSSTLLRHAVAHDFKLIRWDQWGQTARIDSEIDFPAVFFSGQRCISWDGEIWDFNQHRVKQLGLGFAMKTETAHISVVSGKSFAIWAHSDTVPSSLPYVRTVLKASGFTWLEDDRIFVVGARRFPHSSF